MLPKKISRGVPISRPSSHQAAKEEMKCIICKQGDTQGGFTVVTLQREDRTLVIKRVPAEICENCGEPCLMGEKPCWS